MDDVKTLPTEDAKQLPGTAQVGQGIDFTGEGNVHDFDSPRPQLVGESHLPTNNRNVESRLTQLRQPCAEKEKGNPVRRDDMGYARSHLNFHCTGFRN